MLTVATSETLMSWIRGLLAPPDSLLLAGLRPQALPSVACRTDQLCQLGTTEYDGHPDADRRASRSWEPGPSDSNRSSGCGPDHRDWPLFVWWWLPRDAVPPWRAVAPQRIRHAQQAGPDIERLRRFDYCRRAGYELDPARV